MRIVIVGGGISGLAAAHALRDALGNAPQITVLEAGEPGGALQTVEHEGLILELGPDSLVRTKPAGIRLAERLGVPLVEALPGGHTAIVRNGRLHRLPPGVRLLAPTSFTPFALSPVISWPGKMRMALDLLLPRKAEAGDESLASFVRRRLGQEALDRLAQPMIGGIFSGDPEELSLQATMPQLLALEAKHGSIIKGMRATAPKNSAGASYSLFRTPERGFGAMASALVDALPATLEANTPVTAIEHDGAWVARAQARSWTADHLVVALPAPAAAKLLAPVVPAAAEELGSVKMASVATLNLVFDRRTIEVPEAFGFVVPAVEGRDLVAGTFSSHKFPGRGDTDRFVIRLFLGGALRPHALDPDDDALIERALRDFGELTGIRADPTFTLLSRWVGTQPQYTLGHLDRTDRILSAVSAHRGLHLLCNATDGVGIADCARRAEELASSLAQHGSAAAAAAP